MKVIRAEHLGMCFGVRDAIALAFQHSQHQPLTILGDLVHNQSVMSQLRARGVQIVDSAAAVKTHSVMITAHGASDKTVASVKSRALSVLEATCPLVRVAHRAVKNLVAEGYHPIVIGVRGHVEVRGLTEDLPDFDVISSEADIFELAERQRFGIAAQTTQPIDRVRHLVSLVRWRFPRSEVRFVDTVCQPTKQRQNAAIELAQQSDVVVVVGGAHSNNTRELVNTCARFCRQVHHIQTAQDLRPEWFVGIHTVGLTAGTSTPDALVDSVETWLLNMSRSAPESTLAETSSAPASWA